MPFVVTDSCIRCKYTDCVDVCPMDCFRQGPNFLVIAPEDCIDCSMCVPECPVGAIYNETDLPGEQRHFAEINARLAAHPDWKPITRSQAPLPGHEAWRDVANKLEFLEQA
jgi:ferredoxin